ncbi:MAG: hypothetical protein H7173_14470 [Rhodoferax sp.]|nr:hypothetical protein [Pseudorhodobacter sp.]
MTAAPCTEAIYLAQILNHLLPNQPELEGCLPLMLITQSRRSLVRNGGPYLSANVASSLGG